MPLLENETRHGDDLEGASLGTDPGRGIESIGIDPHGDHRHRPFGSPRRSQHLFTERPGHHRYEARFGHLGGMIFAVNREIPMEGQAVVDTPETMSHATDVGGIRTAVNVNAIDPAPLREAAEIRRCGK